jgi:hypothetical protein
MRRFLLVAGLAGCALLAPGLAHAASPDGTGALDYTGGPVANPSTGNVLTFTFSLATGESFQEGEILITVPSGWSTPSTSSSDAGYTTTDCDGGFVDTTTFPGSIWIEGMNASGPFTCSVTYGAPPGPGVSVPASTPGPAVFTTQTKGTLAGTFQPIASSPEVQVLAADGSGDLFSTSYPLTNGSSENGIDFEFSLNPDEDFDNGALQITVPAGWDPPSTDNSQGGYTTSDCGTVSTVGMVITVSGITLTGGDSCEVFYGDVPGPGVTAPTTGGPYTFDTKTKATAGGTFAAIASSPEVQVLAPDGSGTMVSDTDTVANGSTGNTITFTYTAATGGIFLGTVSVVVPPGWTPPSENSTDDGYVAADQPGGCGCPPFITVVGQTIYADLFFLDSGETFTLTYGDTSGGGSGVTAPSTPGKYGFRTSSMPGCGCSSQLRKLAASPIVKVLSADGSGDIKTTLPDVSAGSNVHGTLIYTPAPGGIDDGAVTVDVPTGWSAPSTNPGDPGYVTANAGTVSTLGQTITVSGLTLPGKTLKIKYGAGSSGAIVGSTTGPVTWTTMQKSSSGGTLTALASSPVTTVYAANGSGTLTTPTTTVTHGSTGNSITFTYTAAAGGMSNGSVAVRVPPGWSAPSTSSLDPGYSTVAGGGVLSTSGQFIVVSGLSLSGGAAVTITYGAGSGATAPSSTGTQVWRGAQGSIGTNRVVLGSSPAIAVT